MHTLTTGALAQEGGVTAERPVLVDRFLEDTVEVDVDTVRDSVGEILIAGRDGARGRGRRALRRLGVRAAAAVAPAPRSWAASIGIPGPWPTPSRVCGLINVQYTVKDGQVYVLEANPRASRTVPSWRRRPASRWPWSAPG